MWEHGGCLGSVQQVAMNGHGNEALKYFEQMCEEDVQPYDITFICLLSACSHAGLVDEGMDCYASMVTDCMISAKLEHYTCIVNLLGHAGHLQQAENMVMAMPWKPHVAAWIALLGACRIHGNAEKQNVLPDEFLKWSLQMLLVMCRCQTSMLLLATGISVRMLNIRERKKGG
jgi:pentatricopeptide repeat protein